MKKIEDYLHLYLGCECEVQNGSEVPLKLTGLSYDSTNNCWWGYFEGTELGYYETINLKPFLRPLSDMTHKEAMGLATLRISPMRVLEILTISNDGIEFRYESFEQDRKMYVFIDELSPTMFRLLLKNSFDLFGLIEDGLALPKLLSSEQNVQMSDTTDDASSNVDG